jgi:hypothetical protein
MKFIFFILLLITIISCNRVSNEDKDKLIQSGFSKESINRVTDEKFNSKDIDVLISLKQVTENEPLCFESLKVIKLKNADSLLDDFKTLLTLKANPEFISQLIDIKVIPFHTDDIFELKQNNFSDSTILKISKLIVEKKTKASGYDYAVLKTRNFDENMIMKFIQLNGTPDHVNYIRRDFALGLSAQESFDRAFDIKKDTTKVN